MLYVFTAKYFISVRVGLYIYQIIIIKNCECIVGYLHKTIIKKTAFFKSYHDIYRGLFMAKGHIITFHQSNGYVRSNLPCYNLFEGGGPRVVVSTAAFHARVRGSVPGLGGLKETNTFLPHPLVKVSIVGSLRDREVAYSASDLQGSNFESCVWRTVSSQSSHHPQGILLAQFKCAQRWPKARFISFNL